MKRFISKVMAMLLILATLTIMAAAVAFALPATWLAHYVARASHDRIQLAHARGLLHNGSGILMFASGSSGTNAAHWQQRLEWNISLRWPFQVAVRINWPEVGKPLSAMLHAHFRGWSVEIAPWHGVIPLSALSGFGAPFNTLALDGEAHVALSSLRLSTASDVRPQPADSNVKIRVVQLSSAMVQGVALGDYWVSGTVSAGGATYDLTTTDGALLLTGKGICTLQRGLACHFNGTARAAEHNDALLGNLLGLLGKSSVPAGSNTPVTELRW